MIKVSFATQDCQACPWRSNCTHSATGPCKLKFKPQSEFETLQMARMRQTSAIFKQRYDSRAGIEGTLSLAVNRFDLRYCRYVGRLKTHLQHLLTATALNLFRLHDWLAHKPRASTRISRFKALAPSTHSALTLVG